jgi:uncharacterized membrane protein
MFGTLLELSPARREMTYRTYAELEQKLHPHGQFMFFAIVIALISSIYITWLVRKRKNVFYLSLFSSFAILVSFIVTVAVHLPINQATDKWDLNHAPADWQAKRSTWENWHPVSAISSVAALGAMIVSLGIDRPVKIKD